jgi:putative membrane protein
MIVNKQLSVLSMLFSWRGTVVPRIWTHILLVAALAVIVTAAPKLWPGELPEISLAPFSLLGFVLSIFLGFRNNACYDRWWEGRKQWGHIIEQSRALARKIPACLPHDQARRQRLLRRVIGFAACLAARLREQDEVAAAAPFLPESGLAESELARLKTSRNRPAAILAALTLELAEAQRRGEIGEVTLQSLENHVQELNAAQTACERIRTTPMPFTYSLLLHRTSWIFCLFVPFGLVGACGWFTPFISAMLAYAFFGLDALGDELQEPFGLQPNHLPLNALVRVIEIELLEAAGETDLPQPLAPLRFVLD